MNEFRQVIILMKQYLKEQYNITWIFSVYFPVEELLSLINDVAMQLSNGSFDTNLQLNILAMYNNLKLYALQLEEIYKGLFVFIIIYYVKFLKANFNALISFVKQISWIGHLLPFAMGAKTKDCTWIPGCIYWSLSSWELNTGGTLIPWMPTTFRKRCHTWTM